MNTPAPAIDHDCNAAIAAYDKAIEDLIEAARNTERTRNAFHRAKDAFDQAEVKLQIARTDLRQTECAKFAALKKRDG